MIEKLYAVITDTPDGEGIVTMHLNNGQTMPIVSSRTDLIDKAMIDLKKAMAQSNIPGKNFKVLEFSKRKDVTELFNKNIIMP